jgi:Prokaryotic Cytochrome C oxidase subunit IV
MTVAGRLTIVWLFLMMATAVSWLIGHGSVDDHRLASVGVIALAFVKVRYIGLDFMELRFAPRALRIAFEGWVLAVGGVLILMTAT